MPFSFICYKYEKLIDIKITFPEEVEERNVVFGKGLLHNQYQKKSEYELDEKGKVSFFKKNRNNQVNIWALIDITDMDRNDVLLFSCRKHAHSGEAADKPSSPLQGRRVWPSDPHMPP